MHEAHQAIPSRPPRPRRASFVGALLATILFPLVAGAAPFTYLDPAFTQSLYGVANNFFGGVAFAPDGDVWVDFCSSGDSPLNRFDHQTTVLVNGTNIHPLVAGSPFPSAAGCGLTNHPNGFIYTNTSSGVIRLNASTGAIAGGPFGQGGNALGIAPDPQTGNLVYVGSNGTIYYVDAALTTAGTFSTATTGNFQDGIYFDPSGNFLMIANRSPSYRLTILSRNGTLVQHVPMSTEPDGIAFRGGNPQFVVTNNLNGTMTRFDFPGNDFTQVPVQSLFASGGFRGDLSQVGTDGCLYLTQAGTRYDNGVVTSENSVVRICPGFQPPVAQITLTPDTATNFVGQTHTVKATVSTPIGTPIPNVQVAFIVVSGPNTGATGTCSVDPGCLTGATGEVSFSYVGSGGVGLDVIEASFVDEFGNTQVVSVTKQWIPRPNNDPVCDNAVASPAVLWPPNHRFVEISIEGVTDPDGDSVAITVTGISQDEPLNTRGDGATCPDGQIVDGVASVRAERSGTPGLPGNGRVYHIAFTASDGKGGACSGTVTMCVPHDQGGGASCIDDGRRFNSLGPCNDGLQLNQEATQAALTVAKVEGNRASLEFALPQDTHVELSVFDVAGRRMATVEKGLLTAGVYERSWDMSEATRGLYFVRLRAGSLTLSRTIAKLR